jgi:hypothetical protein
VPARQRRRDQRPEPARIVVGRLTVTQATGSRAVRTQLASSVVLPHPAPPVTTATGE